MHTVRLVPLLALLVSAAAAAPLAAQDRCDHRLELDGALDGSAVEGVLVDAASGSLEVVGGDGEGIRVRAVVCASDETLASQARLVVEPRRGVGWIQADVPATDGRRDDYARMDLVVEMPRGLAADIRDSSGEVLVRSIAAAHIEDGSGSIRVEDVPGAVEIRDNSGDIVVARAGSVEIEDGSGGIDVQGLTGSLHIREDGSGSIEARDVTGDVRIDADGSGSIEVERVGGDFVVERDGSGSVRHRDVRGAVRVPDGR